MNQATSLKAERICIFLIPVHLVFLEGVKENLRILVNYSTKVTISFLVNNLKGVSSRLVQK
ncbi:Uncharacterized protein PRO82_000714 [Candidatus Protochlamydia amoebophila]|nr:Uncharacterized protein [Candidatus Protochlamydia amoebophila]